MAKFRNSRIIDGLLLVFLCLTILSLGGPRSDHGPGIRAYIHASSGILLTSGIFLHIVLHRRWFKPALARRKRGGGARHAAYGWLTLVVLVAFFSGFAEIASPDVNLLHHVAGFLALFGLAGHTVRRLAVMRMWLNSAPSNRPRTVHKVSANL